MGPGQKIRVLSICDDDSVRFSRELVLKQDGYQVESLHSSAKLEASWLRTFHIAILCHSIGALRAAHIAGQLRGANPSILALRIQSASERPDSTYDAICEALPSPNLLLQCMGKLRARAAAGMEREEGKRA